MSYRSYRVHPYLFLTYRNGISIDQKVFPLEPEASNELKIPNLSLPPHQKETRSQAQAQTQQIKFQDKTQQIKAEEQSNLRW